MSDICLIYAKWFVVLIIILLPLLQMHDGNSNEPLVLCYLKGYRNTIPVPKHWSQKRRYLQNRRGWVKPPFQLPQYIVDTGV